MTSVSVLLPTLNEAANVEIIVEEVSKNFQSYTYEIIIIDDGSTDGTVEIAQALEARYPLTLVQRCGNKGLAPSVMEGMSRSRGDVIVVLDADGSHPVDVAPRIAQMVISEEHDIVIGSRYVQGGNVRNWPVRRRLTSAVATLCATHLTEARDPLSGMFAISRSCYTRVSGSLRPTGFKVLLEILASPEAVRIGEVPICFSNRVEGKSKLSPRIIYQFLVQLLRLHIASLRSRIQPAGALSRRAGLSLIEVLVVLAIVFLLASILTPAVQSAREAARRATCLTKLRNLGLGLQAYHELHHGYPRNQFRVPHDVGPSGQSWSWIVRVLPQIDEQGLYDAIDRTTSSIGSKGAVVGQRIGSVRCPSSSDSGVLEGVAGDFEGHNMGVTNYKAVCGSNWGADATQQLDDIGSRWRHESFAGEFDGQNNGDGIMWRNDFKNRMSVVKIHDGVSHTLLLGEDLGDRNYWSSWAYNTHAFATCAIPLNAPRNIDPAWWPDSMGFKSNHPGGAQFCFADGSTRFFSDAMHIVVYRRLGSRKDAAPMFIKNL